MTTERDLSTNELVHMCLSVGIPAYKGMDYDELYALAMDQIEDSESDEFALQQHRRRCELAIAFVPGVVINDCTTTCDKCSEAETVACYLTNHRDMERLVFSQGGLMAWTQKKLEEKTDQQLRGLARAEPLLIPRSEIRMKPKDELIAMILDRQEKLKASGAADDATPPDPPTEEPKNKEPKDAEPKDAEPKDEEQPEPAEAEEGTAAAVRDRVKNLQQSGGASAAAAAQAAKAAAGVPSAAPPPAAAGAPNAAKPPAAAKAPSVSQAAVTGDAGTDLIAALKEIIRKTAPTGGAPAEAPDLSEIEKQLEEYKKKIKQVHGLAKKASDALSDLTGRLEQVEILTILFAGFFYPAADSEGNALHDPFETIQDVKEFCSNVLESAGLAQE